MNYCNFAACSKTGYSTTMSSARFPNKASKFYDVSVDNGIERLPLDSEEPNIRSKNRYVIILLYDSKSFNR